MQTGLDFAISISLTVYFLQQELLFQLSHHVTQMLMVSREKFVVHVHVLNEVTGVHSQRIVDLARLESKIFHWL